MRSKKKIIAIFFLVAIVLIFFNLLWLSGILFIITLMFLGFNYLVALIKSNILKKGCKSVFAFFILLSIVITFRLVVFDIYLIPSTSMANTLYPKDVILVNKLKYGPKLPRSPYEIPWINMLYYLKDNSKAAIQKKIWKPKRLSGTSIIAQGDIVVFKNFNKGEYFVKRCVGVAGDRLKIVNGELFTNNIKNIKTEHVRNAYVFKLKEYTAFYKAVDSLNINTRFDRLKDLEHWKQAELSYVESKQLENLSSIDSFKIKSSMVTEKNSVFPWYADNRWSLDNYGSILIPKKGTRIKLTIDRFRLYEKILKEYEYAGINKDKDHFFKDGKPITHYVFKRNYYFMMGDNRNDSHDSRYFGFLPERKIIGKVSCVLFSNKDNSFQWNRLFKGV